MKLGWIATKPVAIEKQNKSSEYGLNSNSTSSRTKLMAMSRSNSCHSSAEMRKMGTLKQQLVFVAQMCWQSSGIDTKQVENGKLWRKRKIRVQ